MKFQQPFIPHFPQLRGECAAVHAQVIGQLLAVKGDLKAAGPLAEGLGGKVGEQASPDGLLGDMADLPGQI